MPLVNVVKKIEKARSDLGLAPGEQVLAGCTTNPKGTMTRMTAQQLGGIAGALVADRKARRADDAVSDEIGLAAAFVPGQNFLVLTDHRLLLVKMSAMTGKPKELLASWTRGELADIVVEEGRLAYPMTVVFSDGTAVRVEGAKGSNPKSLVSALH